MRRNNGVSAMRRRFGVRVPRVADLVFAVFIVGILYLLLSWNQLSPPLAEAKKDKGKGKGGNMVVMMGQGGGGGGGGYGGGGGGGYPMPMMMPMMCPSGGYGGGGGHSSGGGGYGGGGGGSGGYEGGGGKGKGKGGGSKEKIMIIQVPTPMMAGGYGGGGGGGYGGGGGAVMMSNYGGGGGGGHGRGGGGSYAGATSHLPVMLIPGYTGETSLQAAGNYGDMDAATRLYTLRVPTNSPEAAYQRPTATQSYAIEIKPVVSESDDYGPRLQADYVRPEIDQFASGSNQLPLSLSLRHDGDDRGNGGASADETTTPSTIDQHEHDPRSGIVFNQLVGPPYFQEMQTSSPAPPKFDERTLLNDELNSQLLDRKKKKKRRRKR